MVPCNNGYRFDKVIVVFLVVFSLCSWTACGPIIQMVYGVHQPKYRSDKAVTSYAGRLDWDAAIFRVREYHEDNYKQFRYLGNSMPGVMLFNSAGQLTRFDVDCSGKLKSIGEFSVSEIDQLDTIEKSLDMFIKDTYVINNRDATFPTRGKPVYVVKYAEFAGLLNKPAVPDMVSVLEARNDVQFILLNVDYTAK